MGCEAKITVAYDRLSKRLDVTECNLVHPALGDTECERSLQEKTTSWLSGKILRDDYKFSKMIGQKPLIVILSLNLIGHPYIALEK